MIIVEKKGKTKRYIITCENCKSVLIYDNGDEQSDFQDYFGTYLDFYYIKCPVCRSKVCTRLFSGNEWENNGELLKEEE